MTRTPLTDDELFAALDAEQYFESAKHAAKSLGLDVPRTGFQGSRRLRDRQRLEIQKLGHTITAVFDPNADTETGFLSCFAEPQEAAEFLTYNRGR